MVHVVPFFQDCTNPAFDKPHFCPQNYQRREQGDMIDEDELSRQQLQAAQQEVHHKKYYVKNQKYQKKKLNKIRQ
eukprot:1861578-Amphidinium_carterae.1